MVCQNILPNSRSHKEKERDARRGREEDSHVTFQVCQLDSGRLWCFLRHSLLCTDTVLPSERHNSKVCLFLKSGIFLYFGIRHNKKFPDGRILVAGEGQLWKAGGRGDEIGPRTPSSRRVLGAIHMEAVDLNFEWLKSALAWRAWEGVSNTCCFPSHSATQTAVQRHVGGHLECPSESARTGFSILGWHVLCGRKVFRAFPTAVLAQSRLLVGASWPSGATPPLSSPTSTPTSAMDCDTLFNRADTSPRNPSQHNLGTLSQSITFRARVSPSDLHQPTPHAHIPSRSHRVSPSWEILHRKKYGLEMTLTL